MFEINVLGFQDFANGRRLRKSAVMAETRQEPRNALWRRAEQIARWNQSETNQVSGEPKSRDLTKVKFQDGCVFLAACSKAFPSKFFLVRSTTGGTPMTRHNPFSGSNGTETD